MTIKYNSNYHETMPFSDTCFQIALVANTDNTITIPGTSSTYYQALFSYTYDSNVFICNNSSVDIPVSGVIGTQFYNEFRPEKRYVRGGDIMHLKTPDTQAYVGVSLRQLQG